VICVHAAIRTTNRITIKDSLKDLKTKAKDMCSILHPADLFN
jgi:hypothetical protein